MSALDCVIPRMDSFWAGYAAAWLTIALVAGASFAITLAGKWLRSARS